ncbi:MAG: hypothetical protein LC128_01560 [Chitinophagales bacterium]|nr:hypothetical protein [Chitinophagales bacterium]
MKAWLKGFIHSFPVQLLFLHFRKYQVLLVLWYILFATVGGGFLKTFGADSLFLAPEYLGNVNSFSYAIVGIAVGMFIMSWNIATFILFSKHFHFLAATTNPFLKYCINNFALPLIFLVFYFFRAYDFVHHKELVPVVEIIFFAGGFLAGLIFILAVSFLYFFRADRTILRRMMPVIKNPKEYIRDYHANEGKRGDSDLIHVDWYFETPAKLRKTRDVSHYTDQFIQSIFKSHHFAAILSVFAAFIFLVIIGFFLDHQIFQIPAAASITIFFSILIGVAAAFTFFLQSWSIPYLIVLVLALNIFYQLNWIDPRNKAYGLNYLDKDLRPSYTQEGLMALCTKENVEADRQNMIRILDRWKRKQDSEKPLMVVICVSGGGHRSATFTMKVLQQLDSITHGALMKKTFLIAGASGGMMGATYFRELYLRREKGENIHLQDKEYVDDIAEDLLNPVFSSLFARDLISPAQKFSVGPYKYVKDRGYAFEQKFNLDTKGYLDKQIKDYADDEKAANIPLMFFNSTVSRDGRKMLISTQPVRFMMQGRDDTARIPKVDPDIIDFGSFFKDQDPGNLRVLTALRMNATFPIVLPNVWLPSNPVIDVMDAGLRDNYGQETALRFLESFNDWIGENTSGVLLVQIRDREAGGWEAPYVSESITDNVTKPFLLLQHNWYKMMEFFQNDMLSYYAEVKEHDIYKIIFQYASGSEENKAALNFHLTQSEKNDIISSVNNPYNKASFARLLRLMNKNYVDSLRAEGAGNIFP